jgi:hypothetical protein
LQLLAVAYASRFELSEPQAAALLAALDQLTGTQLFNLLPTTQQELRSARQRLRSELTRSLYCR